MNLDQQADVGEFWASLEKALVDMGEETCLMHSACLPIIADAIEKRNPHVKVLRHPLPECTVAQIAHEFASSGLRFTYVPPTRK